MANVYGADVQQLTDLASSLDQASSQLSATRQSVGAKVQQSAWVGPVADRFRSEWGSGNNAKLASAAQLLSDAATKLRRNASEQTQASAASGGTTSTSGTALGGLSSLTPSAVFDTAEKYLNENAPGLPWTWNQVGGFVPGLGTGLQVVSIADTLSHGQVPVHQMIDVAAGAVREQGLEMAAGGAPEVGAPLYLAGAALGTWNLVSEEAAKTDFSASTFMNNVSYVTRDPLGALDGAGSAIVAAIPDIFSNFTF